MKTFLDVLQSLSILLAAGTAIYGINAWRRETRWKRKYELAEDTLAAFYEFQTDIKAIRSPIGFSGEGESRPKLTKEIVL